MTLDETLQDIKKATTDMWHKGWTEANGGNITVRLDHGISKDIEVVTAGQWLKLPSPCPKLAGELLFATGAGQHLRNIEISPEGNGGIIELSDDGRAYRMIWGFKNDIKPTSELPTHLFTHEEIKTTAVGSPKVLIHCHAPNLIALSYLMELDSNILSKLLWLMQTECLVIFPKGVGFLPWMAPGTEEIGYQSAKLLKKRPLLLWQYHGILATGSTLDEAFGRIHVAEKTAEIFLKVKACAPSFKHISNQQLEILSRRFNSDIDRDILNTILPL